MGTLNSVKDANLKDNDINNVGKDYNRNAINFNSTTVYGPGNSESFTPKFLDLIPNIDCESKHNHVKSSVRTHPTAGEWFLGNETYNTWKSGKSSTHLLWLNGNPGVGKTVICSRVIDDLRNEQDHRVVFFYCHDTPTNCDSRSILTSLLRQLLKYTPSDSSKLFPILKNYNETKLEDVSDLMLTELLQKISSIYGKTFIVIDALNECSNLEDMLQELVRLAQRSCIFISSRDHATIHMKFKPYEQIRIREDDIVEDIRRYVKEVVKIQSKKLRASVTNKLVKDAQGSFLWPVCQGQQLAEAATDEERKAILTTIPQGMQNAIVKSLKTIDSKKNPELLRSALQFVVCTPQPITLEAFSEVMGIIEMKDRWTPDHKTRDPRCLVDDFAGLLICVTGNEKIRYESSWPEGFSSHQFGDDDIVVPFHLCVKDYLLADPVKLPSDLQKYSLYPLEANDGSIAKICLVYRDLVLKHARNLSLDPVHYPFAEYAREWLSRTHTSEEDTDDFQKHGIVISKKNFAIVIVLILMSYVFALMRPSGLPPFLLLGHEQLGSEWEKTVSCKAGSESPKWFGWFGEPVPDIVCKASSVMESQMERRFAARLADEVVRKIRNEGKDTTTKPVKDAGTPHNPLPSPSDVVKEKTDNETGNTEIKFTETFEDWVTHTGSELADAIASKLGVEKESIRIETSKKLVTSLKPPPPPPDIVPGYNSWLDKPRPTTIEEYLSVFEVVFVVDDSSSMEGERWTDTRDALETIAEKASELNVDAMSLCFLNNASYFRGFKGKSNLASLFDSVKPRGKTPLGRRLNVVLDEHLDRVDSAVRESPKKYSKIPPLDIIVLTDGMPTDKGEDNPINVVARAVKRLYGSHYHPNTISVQIIQIANEEKAKKLFKDLVVGDNGRIVDTVPYTGIVDSGKLLRILLGGVHPNIRSQLPVAMLAL